MECKTKVNGKTITGDKFTTKITYVGTDSYNGSTNQQKLQLKKLDQK